MTIIFSSDISFLVCCVLLLGLVIIAFYDEIHEYIILLLQVNFPSLRTMLFSICINVFSLFNYALGSIGFCRFVTFKILKLIVTLCVNYDENKNNNCSSKNHHIEAVIFNHYEFEKTDVEKRVGTQVDFTSLSIALKSINIGHKVCPNFTKKEIEEEISIVANRTESTHLMFFILTHGTYGYISAYDNEFKIDELVDYICKMNKDRKIIIFIQACQSIKGPILEDDIVSYTLKNKNCFVVYATTPGYAAKRNAAQGSWFIQYFCDIIQSIKEGTEANIYHIMTLLIASTHSTAIYHRMNQIPMFSSSFIEKMSFKKIIMRKVLLRCGNSKGSVTSDASGSKVVDEENNVKCVNLEHVITREKPSLDVIASEFPSRIPHETILFPHNGRAIIILNKSLPVESDEYLQKRITNTLLKIGFQEEFITRLNNCTTGEITSKLQNIKDNIEQSENKPHMLLCIAVADGENGYLYSKNGKYAMNQLWAPFRQFKSLTDKLKIFLVDSDETNYVPERNCNDTNDGVIDDEDFIFLFGTHSKQSSIFIPYDTYYCLYLTCFLDIIDVLYDRFHDNHVLSTNISYMLWYTLVNNLDMVSNIIVNKFWKEKTEASTKIHLYDIMTLTQKLIYYRSLIDSNSLKFQPFSQSKQMRQTPTLISSATKMLYFPFGGGNF